MRISLESENWRKGGGTLGSHYVHGRASKIQVQCYPLANILAAANIQNLDLLALDVQGAELEVRQTIPWDVFNIQVI